VITGALNPPIFSQFGVSTFNRWSVSIYIRRWQIRQAQAKPIRSFTSRTSCLAYQLSRTVRSANCCRIAGSLKSRP